MKQTLLAIMCAVLFVSAAGNCLGSVIVYSGVLTNGVTVTGTNTQPAGSFDNPIGANYYSFIATAGDSIDIFADRLVGAYDPVFWVFAGVFADTDEFLGGDNAGFDFADLGFVDFGDDEDAPNIAGPFLDPHVVFVALTAGSYTVAVTNGTSDPSAPLNTYPFELTKSGASVPEPSTFAVLGIAAIGMTIGVVRRSRRGKSRTPLIG